MAGAFELAPGDLSVAVRVEMIEVTGQEGNPPGFIASDLSIAICIGISEQAIASWVDAGSRQRPRGA